MSGSRKLFLIAVTVAQHALSLPTFIAERLRARGGARLPRTVLRFPDEVLARNAP